MNRFRSLVNPIICNINYHIKQSGLFKTFPKIDLNGSGRSLLGRISSIGSSIKSGISKVWAWMFGAAQKPKEIENTDDMFDLNYDSDPFSDRE
jgi:hypothetical protein